MSVDNFSSRLQELMEMEGLSKRALSLKIGVDRASIRLWLSGRFYPRYDALIKLAVFFKVRIDSLVGEENQEKDVAELKVIEEPFCADVHRHFQQKVQAYMTEMHYTRYALAKNLNIDQKALIHWLTNGSMPETATIIRLAGLMKISIDELLGRQT